MTADGLPPTQPSHGDARSGPDRRDARAHDDPRDRVSPRAGRPAGAWRVLLPAVREADAETLVLAGGFSCREQIEAGAGRETLHVAELLARRAGLEA